MQQAIQHEKNEQVRMYEELAESFLQKRKIKKIIEKYESRVNEYGYSLKAPYVL